MKMPFSINAIYSDIVVCGCLHNILVVKVNLNLKIHISPRAYVGCLLKFSLFFHMLLKIFFICLIYDNVTNKNILIYVVQVKHSSSI